MNVIDKTLKHFNQVQDKLSYYHNLLGFSDPPCFQYMEEKVSFEHYRLFFEFGIFLFGDNVNHSVDNYLSYNMEDIQ